MEGTAVVKGCGVLILAASELKVEVTGSRPSWGLKELKFSCMLATNKMPGQGGVLERSVTLLEASIPPSS